MNFFPAKMQGVLRDFASNQQALVQPFQQGLEANQPDLLPFQQSLETNQQDLDNKQELLSSIQKAAQDAAASLGRMSSPPAVDPS